jgi:hypothetical protein
MPKSTQCGICGAMAIMREDGRFWCSCCGSTDEAMPYDRVHYFEDEDLFPEPDWRDESSCSHQDDDEKDDQ